MFESKYSKAEWYTVKGGADYGYRPSKAKVRSHFPFDLGFAMTDHKSQGRTMRKLTLVISERPVAISQLNWSAIYVALSRVEKREDIRFLLEDHEHCGSVMYVTRLRPNADVKLYFSRFKNTNGSTWDPEKCYDFDSS